MIRHIRRLAAALLVAVAVIVGLRATEGQAPPRTEPAGADQGRPFVCGTDTILPNPIPLRWSTVVLAGDGRLLSPCATGSHPAAHREVREATLLERALESKDAEIRRTAVQAIARTRPAVGAVRPDAVVRTACREEVLLLGSPVTPLRWHPGDLFQWLGDEDPRVRQEAAYGIGLQLSRLGLDPNVAIGARTEIEACLGRQVDGARISRTTITLRSEPVVRGLLLEALGAIRYGDNLQRGLAETLLTGLARGATEEILGAVKGLEALIRQDPRRPVSDATRARLRELVFHGARATPPPGDAAARIRRLALMALVAARDDDPMTLTRASADADWQVRRLVASGLAPSRPEHSAIAAALAVDPVSQVRYELVSALARDLTRTRLCAPLLTHLSDREPLVAMRAMDVLTDSCTDREEAVAALVPLANQLSRTESRLQWHKPSRALTALARLAPEEAAPRMPAAVNHQAWQVRAAAASAGALMGSPEAALAVWRDPAPNVRTAALEALARLKTPIPMAISPTLAATEPEDAVPAVVHIAIDALATGTDHQLLRAAAMALRGTPQAHRDKATKALLVALRRLTDTADDTSRDPRVAILDRLGELMPPERSGELLPYTADFDDEVVAAAGKAVAALGGTPPAQVPRQRRYPYQPTEDALRALPGTLEIALDAGTVTIELLPSVAPVTIARVAALARAGHYNGLTFHRIVPNFVVQGGSPGANEYVGVSRYMRDEPGLAPHLRGAVGISTRGRDTGDAQLFIDLVDVPRLDRDYTVLGYVRSGMEIVDRLLEGATIKSIFVK